MTYYSIWQVDKRRDSIRECEKANSFVGLVLGANWKGGGIELKLYRKNILIAFPGSLYNNEQQVGAGMKLLGKIALLLLYLSPFIIFTIMMTGFDGKLAINHPLSILFLISAALFVIFQLILYITNVFKNPTVAKDRRSLWIFSLLFFHWLAFTIYWYLHIWKDDGKIPDIQEQPISLSHNLGINRSRSKSKRLLLLAINLLPLILLLIGVFLFLIMEENPENPALLTFGFLFIFSYLGLIAFNVLDVSRNQNVRSNDRMTWIFVLIFGNLVAYPFYWYIHIWKERMNESNILV